MNRTTPARLASGAAATALVLALAACNGADSSGSSSGGLEGEPIKLGSILTITHPGWDNSAVQTVNEAWAAYINEELGGVDGRPVEVESCDDHGDPAKTSQCLNNLLDSGVVALVNNSSLAFGANALPAMEQAGVANIGGWPVSADEYVSSHNFPTTPGASGTYPSLAVYFAATGAEKLAVAYTNTPSGQEVGASLKELWQELGGKDYYMTEFDPTAADFTPMVSKIAAEKPDAVILAVGEGAAARMFQAARNVGLDVPLGASSTAATPAVFDAAGDSVEGAFFAFAAVPADHDSEDAETYRTVLGERAPDLDLTGQTAVAASSMQYAYDLLSSIEGEITRESVLEQLRKGEPWEGFLTHPTDPANAPEGMPQISNPYALIQVYQDGTLVSAPKIDNPGDLADYIDNQGDLSWVAGNKPGS
ncbi:ABC transporter substrate-binding protein [Thermobifida cellulosilytica]|uniref:Leucine-binding protein domain-containing protein n=1 Tax=Thermobifida cellulosilytica TB100 TaxID=665004 RepID=A0A147KKV4_THECS|nr:ABC transporter substrate-binding protein [Thermobifida cellulosilytica]KUP97917.1 hypothetical protein AC529_04210 [Thermobifida cellulosilytica TB100]